MRSKEIVREFIRAVLFVDIKDWHYSVDHLTSMGLKDSEIAVVESFIDLSTYFYFSFIEEEEYFSSAEFKSFSRAYRKIKSRFESTMLLF